RRTGQSATKCPQIAAKRRLSRTVRYRTDDEAQLLRRRPSQGGLEAGEQVRREQLELLRPDARFTRDRDPPVTLRDRRGGLRETRPGDPLPRRLDAREKCVRIDVSGYAFEGGGERARSEASHGARSGSGER